MKIFVINSGSSSIKYQLFDMAAGAVLTTGLVDRIGQPAGQITHKVQGGQEVNEIIRDLPIKDHRQGLAQVAALLMDTQVGVIKSPSEITAIGHRVVHGGEQFSQPVIIDEAVRAKIKELFSLAPLHNPANLEGIQVAAEIFPQAVQVAIFDTAFHQSMPPAAYRYAIPEQLYQDHAIRVYGFHGTSHLFVTKTASHHLGRSLAETNLITAHLGNGCSITAVKAGKSVDTSMGFSPLAGLVMGTRSGDLDPAIIHYLGVRLALSFEDINRLLNKESGLLGLTGKNDVRDIQAQQAAGDPAAQLALDIYTYRIKKYIGAYMAVLGRVDGLVFTAGVGENSPYVRQQACQGLENLGIILDPQKNEARSKTLREIQAAHSPVKILVIPTNEELEIANQTLAVIKERLEN